MKQTGLKKVAQTARHAKRFVIRSARLRYRDFLSVFGIKIDGIAIPEVEVLHESRVAMIIPYDPQKKVVYMVEQPRIAVWLGEHACRCLDDSDNELENLVGREIPKEQITLFDFPAGRLEQPGQSLRELAHQELYEEIGLRVKDSDLTDCGIFYSWPGNCDGSYEIFLARVYGKPETPQGDGTEDLSVWAIPIDELDEFIERLPVRTLAMSLGIRLLRERLKEADANR